MNSFARGFFSTAILSATVAGADAAINYPDFSSVAGLQLNGSAAQAGSVLRLTDDLAQGGSAFSTTPVVLSGASFSTYFSFRISDPVGWSDGDGQGADGIVFVVQTLANNVGGSGGGIGYAGIGNSVGVEYDTWHNGELGDNDGNHLGVDLNGSLNSVSQVPVGTRMNDGNVWHSWVDYNGATDTLEVRLSTLGVRPLVADISFNVDLETILGSPNAFVGFTSGTGAAGGDHDILQWEFRAEYDPIETGDPVPEVQHYASVLGALMAGAHVLRRRLKKV